MPEVNFKASVNSYQQLDGSNSTNVLLGAGAKFKHCTVEAYAGVVTDYKTGGTGAALDARTTIPYGKSPISGCIRVKSSLTPNYQSAQIRMHPVNVSVPLAKKSNFYTQPYAVFHFNDKEGYAGTKICNITGVSRKLSKNMSIYGEVQFYDLTKVRSGTTSVNAGINLTF